MPGPGRFDRAMSEIEALHATVVTRLRSLHWSNTDPKHVKEALDEYVAAVSRCLETGRDR